jgi:nickel-dependent lactate racemase
MGREARGRTGGKSQDMIAIHLRTKAWFGDDDLTIDFPDSWQVFETAPQDRPALTDDQMRGLLAEPIGTRPLAALAKTRLSAAIVTDDLTRPTPAAVLLPLLMEELKRAGMVESAITIIVAGGTHPPETQEALVKKVGTRMARAIKLVPHDCRCDLVDLGQSPAGLPLQVNRTLMSYDLKIGVGCIYPHPIAGFSGGAKIILPAVCGADTTRMMHDYLRGARERGGSVQTELRRDMVAVARRVGLDFIANVVLNRDRRICGLFAGDPVAAHEQGMQMARVMYQAAPIPEADVVVADMYPFDTSWQFAHDRGLWPFDEVSKHATRVVIAACPLGVGTHDLFPVESRFWARVARRVRHFRFVDLRYPSDKVRTIAKLLREKRQPLMVLSSGLKKDDLKRVFPHARIFPEWKMLRDVLVTRHGPGPVTVAVYRCAPFLLPPMADRSMDELRVFDVNGLRRSA